MRTTLVFVAPRAHDEGMATTFDPMDLEHQAWRARIDELVEQIDLRDVLDLTEEAA